MSSKTKTHSSHDQRTDQKSEPVRSNAPKHSEKDAKSETHKKPDAKRQTSQNARESTHPARLPDPNYNVYLVYFNSIWPRLKFEVGLLIATDERIIRKGHYYEVKGPRPARGYTDRAEYHLYYSIIKSPENSMYFRKIAHIGKMRESKLYLALRIAEQIPPPQVALTYRGESPNCIDWMNNFLFELARFKVIQFDTDFETPKEKRLLTHPSLLSPDELASVGMSPTLSDRYVPHSKMASSSKKIKDNTHSNRHAPSSNQEHSSTNKEPTSKPTTSSASSAKPATSSSKQPQSSSQKPEPSSKNQPSSKNVAASSSKNSPSSKEPTSPQRDKSGAASKSGKIPSSSKQGKDESKHKHLSLRRFFSKK